MVRHLAPLRVLEIGTFDGNTTLTLAANSPSHSCITTVDLPRDWQGSLHLAVSAEYVNVTNRDRVGSQATLTPYASKVSQVFGDSAQLDWSTLGGPFDLIFIDGCHAYDYVRSDTANARRHLVPGGLLVWHDYGMIEDVSRAVDEVTGLKLLTAIRGTRLAIGIAESG
jgi:predicted O-methyltransferase YrrM